MAEPNARQKPRPTLRETLRAGGLRAWDIFRRAYALTLIVIIIWLSYGAIRYLIVSLVAPLETAAQVRQIPTRMDEHLLNGHRPDWLGLDAVENPRAPVGRYHRLTSWIPPDPANTCTQSGCHAPLPHSQRKEVRAFLNMHATSLHCGVCHMESSGAPLALTWYHPKDGSTAPPPVLLQALAQLQQGSDAARYDDAARERLVTLLRQASRAADNDSRLSRAAEHLAAVRASSPSFPALLRQAREVVEGSLRGAYGVKLALVDGGGRPILAHPGTEEAMRDYLRGAEQASQEERERLLTAVHPLRRQAARVCSECHRVGGSLIDFARLGFPPFRIQQLNEAAVFEMIQHISEGTEFHLPGVAPPRAPAPP